jgi:phosphate uptake regulator
VGHDYERIAELAEALNTRVERLRGTPIQGIIQDMTGAMADILELHEVVRRTWRRDRSDLSLPNLKPQVAKLSAAVYASVAKIQNSTIDAITKGEGGAELLVELVLACRHLKRIASLMETVPDELHSFDPQA